MSEETLDPRRHIPLGSVQNLRDLGGYTTVDGGITRWGVFLRSAGLSKMIAADRKKIVDYGLGAVVDLRSVQNIEDAPNPFAELSGVAYHHHDFWGDRLSNFKSSDASLTQETKLADLYRAGFCRCKDIIRQIITTLINEEDHATLFHCGAGKDRTGIVAALLLGLVGVPDDTIVGDYALTAHYLTDSHRDHSNLDPLFVPEGQADNLDAVALPLYFFSCLPGTMALALDFLCKQYGGVEGYIREIGLSDDQVRRLKAKFVE